MRIGFGGRPSERLERELESGSIVERTLEGRARSRLAIGSVPVAATGTILVAHSGMDRMAGYGLKLPSSFRDTHLGPIGQND